MDCCKAWRLLTTATSATKECYSDSEKSNHKDKGEEFRVCIHTATC